MLLTGPGAAAEEVVRPGRREGLAGPEGDNYFVL